MVVLVILQQYKRVGFSASKVLYLSCAGLSSLISFKEFILFLAVKNCIVIFFVHPKHAV